MPKFLDTPTWYGSDGELKTVLPPRLVGLQYAKNGNTQNCTICLLISTEKDISTFSGFVEWANTFLPLLNDSTAQTESRIGGYPASGYISFLSTTGGAPSYYSVNFFCRFSTGLGVSYLKGSTSTERYMFSGGSYYGYKMTELG